MSRKSRQLPKIRLARQVPKLAQDHARFRLNLIKCYVMALMAERYTQLLQFVMRFRTYGGAEVQPREKKCLRAHTFRLRPQDRYQIFESLAQGIIGSGAL